MGHDVTLVCQRRFAHPRAAGAGARRRRCVWPAAGMRWRRMSCCSEQVPRGPPPLTSSTSTSPSCTFRWLGGSLCRTSRPCTAVSIFRSSAAVTGVRDVPLVSISDAQRAPLPEADWIGTVHHGLPASTAAVPSGTGPIPRVSRPHLAREARGPRDRRLPRVRAAAPDRGEGGPGGPSLLRTRRSARSSTIRWSTSSARSARRQKGEFLGGAALLFPIDWPEPFGLVMIEALACGMPVIAFRGGSVPEIIERRRDGLRRGQHRRGDRRDGRVHDARPAACRRSFERRFTRRAHGRANTSQLYRRDHRPRADAPDDREPEWHAWPTSYARRTVRDSQPRPTRPAMPPRVLKHGDTFAVFDPHGDIVAGGGRRARACTTTARAFSRCSSCCSAPAAAASELDDQRRQRRLHRRPDEPRCRPGGHIVLAHGELHCSALASAVRRRLRRADPRVEPRTAARRAAAADAVRRRLRGHFRGARHPARSGAAQRLPDLDREPTLSCATAASTASSGGRASFAGAPPTVSDEPGSRLPAGARAARHDVEVEVTCEVASATATTRAVVRAITVPRSGSESAQRQRVQACPVVERPTTASTGGSAARRPTCA